MADAILGVTARAKDEVSGPMGAAVKAFEDGARALEGANKRVVTAEREKREAMRQARESMKLAQQSAQDLSLAVSGLSGALQALAGQSGVSMRGIVLLQAGLKAFEAGIGAAVDFAKGLATTLATATKESAEFNYRLAEASTLVDTAQVPMGQLANVVRQLAGQYAQSPITEAKALYQAISAGAFTAADATAIMTTANRLAVAGVTDVFTAIDGLTNVVNAWGGSMQEAETYANTFFVAMRDGKTTVPQLASAIGGVAGTARQAGLTFKETAAAIAAITTVGISTDEAVTALNNALSKIVKPSREARAEAKNLGIEFNTAGMRAAGGLAPFLALIAHNSHLTSESIGRLFGNVRGIKAAFALAVNDGAKFNAILGDMDNQAGAVDQGIAKISETVQFQAQRYNALREVASGVLGDMVTKNDAVAGALEGVNVGMTSLVGLLMRTGTESRISREEASRFVREGLAKMAEAFAVLVDATPDIDGWFNALWTGASKVFPPLTAMAEAAALAANSIEAVKAEAEKPWAAGESSDPRAALNEQLGRTADGALKASTQLRVFAAEVRAGAVNEKVAAEIESKANESRKKDLEELQRLYKNLQDQRSQGIGSKQAEKDEKAAHAERVRQVREDLAELDKAEREKKRAKKEADAEYVRLVVGDLKLQEEEAKKRGALLKSEREATDRSEIAAEERMMARRKSVVEALRGVASSLYSGFRTAFSQIIDQEKSFGDAFLAMAADLAAQLAESLLFRGFDALIGAAIGGLGTGPLGLLGKVFGFAGGGVVGPGGQPVKMAEGGMITGGTPGEDSVLVAAMPEEAFLPRYLVRELRRVLAVPASGQASFAAGGVVGGGGGGWGASAPFVFAPQYLQSVPMTAAQQQAHFLDALIPALKRMHTQGYLDFLTPRRR